MKNKMRFRRVHSYVQDHMTDYWKSCDPRLGLFSSINNNKRKPHLLGSSYVPGIMLGMLLTLPLILANITKVSANNSVL